MIIPRYFLEFLHKTCWDPTLEPSSWDGSNEEGHNTCICFCGDLKLSKNYLQVFTFFCASGIPELSSDTKVIWSCVDIDWCVGIYHVFLSLFDRETTFPGQWNPSKKGSTFKRKHLSRTNWLLNKILFEKSLEALKNNHFLSLENAVKDNFDIAISPACILWDHDMSVGIQCIFHPGHQVVPSIVRVHYVTFEIPSENPRTLPLINNSVDGRALDKREYLMIIRDNFFLISHRNHMLWPLIWTVSSRRFRWGVTTYVFMQN